MSLQLWADEHRCAFLGTPDFCLDMEKYASAEH